MTTFARNYAPTAAERAELQDIQDYLAGHAKAGTLDRMPEGSINGFLNRASPAVRQHLMANQAIVENFRSSGGREMPFAEKRTVDDLNVPKETRQILDRADTESVIYGLNERMGTAEQQSAISNEPPSLREHISAAMGGEE